MRLRLGLFIAAIVVAMIGTVLIAVYVSGLESRILTNQKLGTVFVATRRIAKGTPAVELVARGLVKEQQVPKKYISDGAIRTMRGLSKKSLAVPLNRGDQVTKSVMTLPESGLATPKNKIAVSVPIEELALMNGRIKSGDEVAVFITLKPGKEDKNVTKILLGKVLVVAVDKMKTGQSSGLNKASITLAVDPDESEKLMFAASEGLVWVGLWPPGAEEPPDTPGQTLDSLF